MLSGLSQLHRIALLALCITGGLYLYNADARVEIEAMVPLEKMVSGELSHSLGTLSVYVWPLGQNNSRMTTSSHRLGRCTYWLRCGLHLFD